MIFEAAGKEIKGPALVRILTAKPYGPIQRALLGTLGVVCILVFWEICSRRRIVDPALLPPVERVLDALVMGWSSPNFASSEYAKELAFTLGRIVLGFGIAACIGIVSGILIGFSERLSRALSSTLTLARYLPPAVMVPIVILFLGKSHESVLIIIVFGAFWPVLLNTIDGVQGVDSVLVDVARMYRFRSFEVAIQIVLPTALPQIMTGLRLSVSVCLLSAIVAEMLAGTNGIGYSLLIAQRVFSYPDLYAGIVVLGALGLACNWLFRLVETKLLFWHPIGRKVEYSY